MKFSELNSVAEQYNIGKGGKEGWLQLQVGDNKVRVVSEYEVLAKHFSKAKGQKPTICVGKANGCVFCNATDGDAKENKPTAKFFMWVIDRVDGAAKIMEVGWTVVSALGELQVDAEYGFPDLPPYDINVKKAVKGNGSQPSDTEYTVVPGRANTEITPAEMEIISKLTPIKEVVESMRSKVQDAFKSMGLAPAPEAAPQEAVPFGNEPTNDAPSFLQPTNS